MKKLILIGSVVAALGIGVATYYFFSNLNMIVAGAIEEHGSRVTGTSVGVSGVDISVREGRGSIRGLDVASPDGFDAPDAFVLDDITVDLDVGSVRKDPIVIESVQIKAPAINAQFLENGASNIDELRKHIQSYTGAAGKDSGAGSGAQAAKDIKRVRIKSFVMEGASLEVDASALGMDKRSLTLPAIHMSNVGGNSGLPPDQLAQVILKEITRQATSEIAHSEIQRLIEDKLGDSITDKAKDLIDKIGH